jgi:deoxyhypusine synthase
MKREDLLSEEIEHIDLENIDSIESLVESMGRTSFQARALADVAHVWEDMLNDDVTVFLGLSGAMIAGGLRKVVVDILKNNMADVVVSTGAILYQDLYQAAGYHHYKGDVNPPDAELHEKYIDRIYDTYVDEYAFRTLDVLIGRKFAEDTGTMGTRQFMHSLADMIDDENSILQTCKEMDIPVFCPAIADSSIGIGLAVVRSRTGKGPTIDTIQDNMEMAKLVNDADRTGAVYLGGGVPKNYINDAVVTADMIYGDVPGHEYAVQITMDRPEWGGLSGSTLGEAQSWGKVNARAKKAMVFVDMALGLPLVAGYLISQEIGRQPRSFSPVSENLS